MLRSTLATLFYIRNSVLAAQTDMSDFMARAKMLNISWPPKASIAIHTYCAFSELARFDAISRDPGT